MNLLEKSIIVGEDSLNEWKFEKIEKSQINVVSKSKENWWKPSSSGNKRIMLCGTYPIAASNGYSKVVYYISKHLGNCTDIDLTIYGFQNFSHTVAQGIRNDIPKRVKIHDAFATENPQRNGFGEIEITDYVKENPQDIIIIFNDNMITSAIVANLVNECWSEKKNFKLVSYMDQVYPYQKPEYIQLLNKHFDAVIAFTPYWKNIARKLGIREDMPMFSFPHGFDESLYYPVPMKLSRLYYSFDQESFLVLNLNRNQPRKRWDTTIIAWAEFVERHYNSNIRNLKASYSRNKHTKRSIKLVVGTQMDGYWNLMDIFENEIKFRDVPWEYAKNTIQSVSLPQQMSDRDINILYNSCDIGLNTADGEGFGLCGFEGAALGKAQVSANVGGMKEFLNNQNSLLVEPVLSIYLDNKSKGIGGKAELTNPSDYAEAFWKYLSNPEMVKKHGQKSRENILTNYRWESVVNYFYKEIIPKL